MRRGIGTAVAVAVATVMTVVTAQSAHAADGDTSEGTAKAATQRWASEYGLYRRTNDLATRTTTQNGVTVTAVDPASASSPTTTVTRSVNGAIDIAGSAQVTAQPNVAAFASPGSAWVNAGNDCASRFSITGGYTDACYKIRWENSDNDSSYDYYTFEEFATAKSTGIYTLKKAWVNSSRSSNSAGSWSWVDWSPKSDQSAGNCTSVTLGVSDVASLSVSYQLCDKWDIDKSSTAGTFKNTWEGNAYRSDREVAYLTTIKTPQDKTAVWNWNYGLSTAL